MTGRLADQLAAARALIESPASWLKGGIIENAQGQWVRASDPTACRFCAAGACMVALGRKGDADAISALHDAAIELGYPSVGDFNDAPGTTHEDVLRLFDAAITKAAGEGA